MNQPAKQYGSAIFLMLLLYVFAIGLSSCSADRTTDSTEAPAISLHEATFLGDVEAVQAHIAAGTDMNQKDDFGSTPLHVATTFGKTEVAAILIAAGADVNALNSEGSTALHTAAFFCRTAIVEELLKKGADISIQNNYGSTALQSVSGPFAEVKMIYDDLGKALGPYGLKLDYDHLEKNRPVVAQMIQDYH